ncbi:MAG: hypothetical protein KY437_08780 [Actinobacteria bacterium]|nr:hypothetical protein [Actinomycetota bacterium]
MFVYTREAHPGAHVPAHATFDDKLAAAGQLRDVFGISRPILVDDLDGTAHRAYGSMPNMTWVVGRGGRLVYKAEWTSATNVEAFVDRHTDTRGERTAGVTLAPYVTEQLEHREVDRQAFYRHLEQRNGPRSLAEFREAERIWSDRG